MSGIDCIQRLKMLHPRMQMMVLTVYDNPDNIFNALKAGATSYLLKGTPPEKVIEAIRKATNWALSNLQLTDNKKKTLIAWSHYFCGIHEYLDHKRGASMKEAIAAIKKDGLHKFFLILTCRV